MPPEAPAAPAAITTDAIKAPAGPIQAAEKVAATTAAGTVMVKPTTSYFCSTTNQHRTGGGEAYPVEPSKAAELFARGLVDYDKAEDETRAAAARIKAEGDAIRARRGR